MDPASGLDSIRDVAIQDGKIVAMSAEPLQGIEIVDVTGKVVAPGFVDLHAHGQTTGDMQLQARDGVTTALDMESGVYPVAQWYANLEDAAPLNYGATVSHRGTRFAVLNGVEIGHWRTNPDKVAALGLAPLKSIPTRRRARYFSLRCSTPVGSRTSGSTTETSRGQRPASD